MMPEVVRLHELYYMPRHDNTTPMIPPPSAGVIALICLMYTYKHVLAQSTKPVDEVTAGVWILMRVTKSTPTDNAHRFVSFADGRGARRCAERAFVFLRAHTHVSCCVGFVCSCKGHATCICAQRHNILCVPYSE
jgi:hypothetical protein